MKSQYFFATPFIKISEFTFYIRFRKGNIIPGIEIVGGGPSGLLVDNKLGKEEDKRKVWLLVVDKDLVFSWPEGIKFTFLLIPVWVSLMHRVGGLVMRGVVDMAMVALSWVVAVAFFSYCLVTKHF